MDITINGCNSERFPPIKKNLAYYFPLDETLQCCVQSFKYIDVLCIKNSGEENGELYKKLFLDLRATIKLINVNFDEFTISSDMFKKGQYNAIAVDAVNYTITDNFKKALRQFSKNNQIPILVLNSNINEDVYNIGGVSVLYFTSIPTDDILLNYIEKGIRYSEQYSCSLNTNYILVKDTITLPIHNNISDFTISIDFRLNTINDNNLIFSLENNNGKIVSIVYNKQSSVIKAEYKSDKSEKKIDLETNRFYRLSITKQNRLVKIYLGSKKIFEYQYDIPIKATEIILGRSGNLGYTHIANNMYKDLWVYKDCKGINDIEMLSKSILTMLS